MHITLPLLCCAGAMHASENAHQPAHCVKRQKGIVVQTVCARVPTTAL